ncbi:MAG: HEPN domain-containing protein [Ardenticatenia bacterium]|nr:HEPN domain-containing protein [Ardenticatenia bacterium]
MDDAKADEIRTWLLKALHDLQSAEWLLVRPDPLCSAASFHCQQAGEKALKAYLTWRDEPFDRTHSLVALIAICCHSMPLSACCVPLLLHLPHMQSRCATQVIFRS